MNNEKLDFDTLLIHGAEKEDMNQALNPPIYMTSTFTFKDIQQAADTFEFKRNAYVYTRGGNPTINLFEERMAVLEGGAAGVAFGSGMAAITTTLLSLVQQNEKIIAHRNLYGSTFAAMTKLFPKFGIQSEFVDLANASNLEKYLDKDAKVVYLETPTNPSLEIIDIAAISKIAHAQGVKVVVDNTFATPYLQQPLKLGADVVVHSATKYISGHGDVLAGVAVGKEKDYVAKLKFGHMCELGCILSPFNAWLLLRGLKTLGLRMDRHVQNAEAIVKYLKQNSKVEKIIYPSMPHHPNGDIAKKQMRGFGGIVSFELKGDVKDAQQFIKKLKMAKLAVSLGDAETLVEIPALMTHKDYPEKKLQEFGFSKKTIRISAGLESAKDIIADIDQAL